MMSRMVREVEYWWKGTEALLEVQGTPLTWELFKTTFLEKYFPMSARNQKEIEFLQLKQRNMIVGQYVSKFEELSKFSSYLKYNPDEAWKAVKFEYGLRLEIKNGVSTTKICNFILFVNNYKIVEQNLNDLVAEHHNFIK